MNTIKRILLVSVLSFVVSVPLSATAASVSYTTPGTYSFTVPAGVTSIVARVVGAGGGGGGLGWGFIRGGVSQGSDGRSGLQGGVYLAQTVAVTPGQVISVVVGSGGCGGHYYYWGTDRHGNAYGCPFTTFDGTAGGNSSFGSVVATGGGGGYGGINNYDSGFTGSGMVVGTPTSVGQRILGGGLDNRDNATEYGRSGCGGWLPSYCYVKPTWYDAANAGSGPNGVGGNGENGAVLLSWSTTGCANGTDALGNPLTLLSGDTAPAEQNGKYKVNKFGGNYCFGNTSSSRYLIPLKTWSEFSSLWNNIQAGSNLPGLYRIP